MRREHTATYERAREFLHGLRDKATVAVSFHGDADGTSSAVLALLYLERTGRRGTALSPGKGERLYGDGYVARLRECSPEALLVLDQGSRPRRVLEGVPTLVVDHHDVPPGGVPVEVFLSGLHERPVPSTSVMTWRLLTPLADLEDRFWLAAVGAMGDLGPDAPFPEVAEARRRCGLKNLTETVALINAAKRSSAHDTALAVEALLAAEAPADLAKGRVPQCLQLAEYRQEVQAERNRCTRTAPRFAGDWALLRFSSPCQIHGPLAASWVGRMPRQIVMAANDGYTEGNVHFSIRTARPGENLLERLRAFREVTGSADLGQGHARATGGVLPVEKFERFLEALGFEEPHAALPKAA